VTPPASTSRPIPTSAGPSWWSLWLPVLAICAAIFILSSFSQLPAPPDGISDKHEHFTAYFVLGLSLIRALARGRLAGVTWRVALLSVLLVSAYGASDEFHQSFVPGRDSDVLDWRADTIGGAAAAGLVLAWAIIRRSTSANADVLRDPDR
jgi:VanZ family protein